MANRNVNKEAALSLEALRSLLHYDPETGLFFWLKSAHRRDTSKPAGFSNGKGYLQIRIGKERYLLSRLAWFYVYGEWPVEIDHVNRNRDDNRLVNLRSVNRAINCQNTSAKGSLGIKHISRKRNGFLVQIVRNKESICRKAFPCLGQAVKARNSILAPLEMIGG